MPMFYTPAAAPAADPATQWRVACERFGGYPGYVPNQAPFNPSDWGKCACLIPYVAGTMPFALSTHPGVDGGAYLFDSFWITSISAHPDLFGAGAALSAFAENAERSLVAGGRAIVEAIDPTAWPTGSNPGDDVSAAVNGAPDDPQKPAAVPWRTLAVLGVVALLVVAGGYAVRSVR